MDAYPQLDRASAENGIWLCNICHSKVDSDPSYYTPERLFGWKAGHQVLIQGMVGLDLESALIELRNTKRCHQETRELLSFLDDRRMLYEGLDHEFPPRVLQSIELMRAKIIQTRAQVSPASKVAAALGGMQSLINQFMRNVGPRVDLNDLRCDSRDPVWVNFSEALLQFRSEMIVIVAFLAEGSGYEVMHVY
ncbi:hypothetical protein EBA23_11610 [Xanthomonas oryzae pv. oryzae]|nr:hypothetical protein EBA23_11610 [Xanthomonas oryzae pv. oryzae]RBL58221.1 hypothetical protein BRN25_22850 [Xanthomonas oryzae pv. oryzae]